MPPADTARFWIRKKRGSPPLPSGFGSWPKSYKVDDPDDPNGFGVELYDSCLPPAGARTADILASLATFVIGADMVLLALKVESLEFFLPAMAGTALMYFVSREFFRWFFSRAVWVRIYKNRVEVASSAGFERYKKDVEMYFAEEDHPQKIDEARGLQQNQPGERYFGKSRRVFLCRGTHNPRKHFIADVYPDEKGQTLCAQLTQINSGLEANRFD